MSKLYNKYLELKKENKEALYLFKSGNFYIFLDEDAIKINKITTLKLINLNKDIVKCGFPINSKEKYISIFDNLKLNIKIIDECNEIKPTDKIIMKLKKIDINYLTPIEALRVLGELKEIINE